MIGVKIHHGKCTGQSSSSLVTRGESSGDKGQERGNLDDCRAAQHGGIWEHEDYPLVMTNIDMEKGYL